MLSLLSRNNLQGCRDMGVAPNYLPGYGRLSDEAAGRRLVLEASTLSLGKGQVHAITGANTLTIAIPPTL